MNEPTVVLFGGQGKISEAGDLGFAALQPQLAGACAVVTFGGDGERIAAELRACGVPVDATHASLLEATRAAAALTQERGASRAVLSPGCASFDEFRDFSDRGRHFSRYLDLLL